MFITLENLFSDDQKMMKNIKRLIRYLVIVIPIMSLYTMCFLYESRSLINHEDDLYLSTNTKSSKPMLDVSSEFPVRMIVPKMRRKISSYDMTRRQMSAVSPVPANQLLNLKNFTFLRSSTVCDNEPYFLTLVHSAPGNFIKRQVIRKTWASPDIIKKLNIRVVFIVGMTNDSAVDQEISREDKEHKDIVQGNFVDSYRNLTLKHLAGYKWTIRFCNSTRFVMKVDDDAFVDVFKIVSSMKSMFDSRGDRRPAGVLACSLFPDGTAVKRTGKWALSFEEYSSHHYPPYCSGIAYFTTPDVVERLFTAAHDPAVRPIWIDDLFVTGILPARIRQPHQELNINFTYDHRKLRKWLHEKGSKTNPYLVGDIGEASDWNFLMQQLWEKTVRVSR